MASDNIILSGKRKRYRTENFQTREVLGVGFTSQKEAMKWRKENVAKEIDCIMVAYLPKQNNR